MVLTFFVLSAIALTISFLQPIAKADPISPCATLLCGPDKVCAPCGKTPCNTYDCNNQNGTEKACPAICSSEPACVCRPGYHQASPNAKCTPLICPFVQKKCGAKTCGLHEVCAPCGPNPCYTYTCKNQNGKGMACPDICSLEPACVCEPGYHRASPGAPCIKLQCTKPVLPPIYHQFEIQDAESCF